MRPFILLAVLLTAASCQSSTAPTAVQFKLTSNIGPCSSVITVRMTLDGAPIGEEEFRIGMAPNRTESSTFTAPTGTHTLGARITSWGGTPTANGFAWPDTTVTLSTGQHLVRSIDLYCS
jgi:hypothetical protein